MHTKTQIPSLRLLSIILKKKWGGEEGEGRALLLIKLYNDELALIL